MKKLLSVIFAFVLIFSCFAVTAFANDYFTVYEDKSQYNIFEAEQPTVTFSEDYQKFYMNDEPFSRVDTTMLATDFGYTVLVDEKKNEDYYLGNSVYIEWTDKQKTEIKDIIIDCNEQQTLFRIELFFNDGSSLTAYFLKDTLREEYNNIISGNVNEYIIDFAYPDGNIVIAQKNAMFGETVNLSRNELSRWYDSFSVCAKNSDSSIMTYTGDILIINEEFYYVDYAESGVEQWFLYEEDAKGEITDCVIHKITDEKLVSELKLALENYYDDDYGVLYDDNATDTISAVFLIFVFAVIPFVIFVIFLVKAIRGKGIYKKIYGTVTALCIAEIIVFAILAIIIAPTASNDNDDEFIGSGDGEEYIVLDTEYNELTEWDEI